LAAAFFDGELLKSCGKFIKTLAVIWLIDLVSGKR